MAWDGTWIISRQLPFGAADKEKIMQGSLDNEQRNGENSILKLSAMTVLGDRADQQDCFGFQLRAEEGLAVVCDGMGGMENGRLASESAVETLLKAYDAAAYPEDPVLFLHRCADQANEAVCRIAAGRGVSGQAGTTIVSVLIRKKELYWLSVGDSRGYLYRKGALVQFTQDHNYRTVLEEQKAAGQIDEADYLRQSEKAEALFSYLGLERFGLMDCSSEPLLLMPGDRILLMSDGLYKLAENEEILRIIDNFSNIEEALQALELRVRRNAAHQEAIRDNMTVILIEIK